MKPTPYTRTMDNLRFSDEQRAAIVDAVTTAALAEEEAGMQAAMADTTEQAAAQPGAPAKPDRTAARTNTGRRRAPRRRYAIPAVLAAVLVVGACGVALAAALFHVSLEDVGAQFFGTEPSDPADAAMLGHIGTDGGIASASCDGVSVTVDAIVGDRQNAAIVLNVAREDGEELGVMAQPGMDTPILQLLAFSDEGVRTTSFAIEGVPVSYGTRVFDADPADNAVQYVLTVGSDAGLVGMDAHLSIGAISTLDYDEDGVGTWRTLAEGPWELDFTFDYEDTSQAFEAEPVAFTSGNIDATVSALTVSPIAATITFDTVTHLNEAEYMLRQDEFDLAFLNLPVALVMADGSVVELGIPTSSYEDGGWMNWLGGSSSGSGRTYNPDRPYAIYGLTGDTESTVERTIYATELIDVDNVVALVVGDTEIPVTPAA